MGFPGLVLKYLLDKEGFDEENLFCDNPFLNNIFGNYFYLDVVGIHELPLPN